MFRFFCVRNPSSALTALLLVLSFSVRSRAVTHILQYLCTEVTRVNFPEFSAVGLLDGEQFVYYDSNIKEMIPKTEWMNNIITNYSLYSVIETQKQQSNHDILKHFLSVIMNTLTHTKGSHVLQRMYGCEHDDDGTTRGYDRYGYDGEDFISLNLKTGTWTAANNNNNKAVKFLMEWDPDLKQAKEHALKLRSYCNDPLQYFSQKIQERKDPPTASVFHKHTPSAEVVCHATGFFPKAVIITWRKDGEDVLEGVDLRETLPNQNGSFQKRSVLKVPAEELQKHKYTCVIQHSSLKEEMVLNVAKDGGSDTMRDRKSDGGWNAHIIIRVVAGLVVLIAVITGFISCKKKKIFDFMTVPHTPPHTLTRRGNRDE